ncbi:MAG TPA: hypothetical protein VGL93_02875 [Streptosporangiaceae bacterium]|jgi:hypothetical protein
MHITGKIGIVTAGAAMLAGLGAPVSAATPATAGATGAAVSPRSDWYSQRDHFDDGDKGGTSTHLYLGTENLKYFVAATFYADGEWLYIKPNTSPYLACVTIKLKGPDHTLCVNRNSSGKKNLSLPENKKYTLVLGLFDIHLRLKHRTSLGGGRT